VRFLFATDGSRGADVALDFLSALPLGASDHVTVVTVPVYSFMGGGTLDPRHFDLAAGRGARAAREMAERAASRFAADAVPASVAVRSGPVTEEIQDAALEGAHDLIVIGSRGLGAIAGSVMGSVARALARHASVPVLVVRERRGRPRRVLVAVDGSDDARAAIELLARVPLPADAEITLLHVLEHGVDTLAGTELLRDAARLLSTHRIEHAVVERGRAAEELLARASAEAADLIVLGSRGQTQSGGLLQGSVADRVLSQSHCAVLVAKAPLKPRAVTESYAGRRVALAL
jgi:nucleotide-binding universal stress UspA family protein